jgi:hypothetical protein
VCFFSHGKQHDVGDGSYNSCLRSNGKKKHKITSAYNNNEGGYIKCSISTFARVAHSTRLNLDSRMREASRLLARKIAAQDMGHRSQEIHSRMTREACMLMQGRVFVGRQDPDTSICHFGSVATASQNTPSSSTRMSCSNSESLHPFSLPEMPTNPTHLNNVAHVPYQHPSHKHVSRYPLP